MWDVIVKATGETLYMVFFSTLIAVILGMIPAIILTLTAPDGLKPNRVVYGILDVIVNVFRSFPFIILMVIVIPLTRAIAGKSIGTLFVAWLVLAQVLKQRWAGTVLADERDLQIERVAGEWGRWATASCIIGIALLLGFSDTDRLREFSYPFIAQMLMLTLLWGLWFDQAVAAVLYWRDRRAAA